MDQQLRNEVGDHTAGVTPVPIPNTEVKPRRADCTARETVWESRSSPALIKAQLRNQLSLFRFVSKITQGKITRIRRGERRTTVHAHLSNPLVEELADDSAGIDHSSRSFLYGSLS